MKTAEQIAKTLWQKHTVSECMREFDFYAALKEHGEAVRQRAAGVCRTVGRPVGAGDGGTYVPGTSADCAAAIERMELP